MPKTACTYRLSEEAMVAIDQIAKATGLSATAVVEMTLREAAQRRTEMGGPDIPRAITGKVDLALSRSVLRRRAAQKGEPAPTFLDAASPDPASGRGKVTVETQSLARETVRSFPKPGKARSK